MAGDSLRYVISPRAVFIKRVSSNDTVDARGILNQRNDPHADPWGQLSAEERRSLPSWMKVYYAMTANLDWNVGRLLAALEELGLRENTLLVFTSDHGEMFGAHGRRAKNIFFEEAIRVPFLVRWPTGLAGQDRCDVLLNTPDIMPTLLGLMDLPIPRTVEGSDLSPCLLQLRSTSSLACGNW